MLCLKKYVRERELFRVVELRLIGGSDAFKTKVDERLGEYTDYRLNPVDISDIILSFPAKQAIIGCTYNDIEDFMKTQNYRRYY